MESPHTKTNRSDTSVTSVTARRTRGESRGDHIKKERENGEMYGKDRERESRRKRCAAYSAQLERDRV